VPYLRIRWQWDYYKIKTNDFEDEDKAEEAYEEMLAEKGLQY